MRKPARGLRSDLAWGAVGRPMQEKVLGRRPGPVRRNQRDGDGGAADRQPRASECYRLKPRAHPTAILKKALIPAAQKRCGLAEDVGTTADRFLPAGPAREWILIAAGAISALGRLG